MKKLSIWLLFICTALLSVGLYTRASLATDASKIMDDRARHLVGKLKELRMAGARGYYDKDPAHVSGIPKFKDGEPYSSVRAKMLRAGWKPYHVKEADFCSPGDTRCQGFPEMQSCTGGEPLYCRFAWRKSKKVIGICTFGEDSVFDNICFASKCDEDG